MFIALKVSLHVFLTQIIEINNLINYVPRTTMQIGKTDHTM